MLVTPLAEGFDVESSDETTPSLDLPPPTASRGDQVMQARIAERLFGDSPEPQFVAHYEILRRVGAGGMGVVYAAHDTKLDRSVALKQVRRNKLTEHERQRLIAEARALARLSHPNVIHVYEVGESEGDVYVAMELVDGITLAQWQRDDHPLAEILEHYAAAGAGLHAAHEAGLVHRDFKPANVLVGHDGRIRVADFGLALPVEHDPGPTQASGEGSRSQTSHRVAGTPGYIAPELLDGAPASRASDIYSFCVALWEAVDGERPRSDAGRLLRPRWLRRLLARGLAAQPERRWPDVITLLRAVHRRLRIQRFSRATAVAAPVLVVGAWLGLPRLLANAQPVSCESEPEAAAEAWNDRARRQIADNVGNDDRADYALRQIDLAFERFAERWSKTRTRTCQAHHHDHALSAAGLDRSYACLDAARRKANFVVERLTQANTDVYAHVDSLLASIPRPEDCSDETDLRDHGNSRSPARQLLEDRLTRAGELGLAAGQPRAALEAAQDIAAQATALADPGLEAEALALVGASHYELGQPEQARQAYASAATLAYSAALPELSVTIAIHRAELLAYDFEQPEAAAEALLLCEVMLAKLGDAPSLRADLLLAQALIAEHDDRMLEAEQLVERALELLEVVGSAAKLEAANTRLANVMDRSGRSALALELYAEILERQRARLGPEHPSVATTEFNFALALQAAGRGLESRHLLEHVLELRSRELGPSSIRLAPVLTLLAEIANELGEFDDAIAFAERAWQLQRDHLPPGHAERGMPLWPLGWAQLSNGDFAGSLATHQLIAAQLALDDADRASLDQTIGWLLARLERYDEARAPSQRALLAEDPVVRLSAELVLAELAFRQGQLDDSTNRLAEIDRRIDLLPSPDPALRAEWRWLDAVVYGDARNVPADVREYLQPDQLAQLETLTRTKTMEKP